MTAPPETTDEHEEEEVRKEDQLSGERVGEIKIRSNRIQQIIVLLVNDLLQIIVSLIIY